jgi:hypothetical protein
VRRLVVVVNAVQQKMRRVTHVIVVSGRVDPLRRPRDSQEVVILEALVVAVQVVSAR